MARGGITFSTKVSGPFFDLKGLPLKDAAADTITDLIKEGEAKVQAQLYPGHGARTGQFKSSVHTALMRRSKYATGWGKVSGIPERTAWSGGRNEAIIGYWLEGAARKSEPTRFKGYFMFRKATAHLKRLAREMAGKHYARAVKRLT